MAGLACHWPVCRGIAQLAERRSPKPKVEGSIPSAPATCKLPQTVFYKQYMSQQNVHTVGSTADKLKLGLAALVLLAGIVAYSMLADQPTYMRVGAFVAGLILAFVIAIFSDTGRRVFAFGRESYNETRRVIWPDRKEATRMTAIVFAFVIVMGILLWVADKLLGWVIYGLLLGWN